MTGGERSADAIWRSTLLGSGDSWIFLSQDEVVEILFVMVVAIGSQNCSKGDNDAAEDRQPLGGGHLPIWQEDQLKLRPLALMIGLLKPSPTGEKKLEEFKRSPSPDGLPPKLKECLWIGKTSMTHS